MREVNGWHVPSDCFYFDAFLKDEMPKQNGFQREHLEEAFKRVKKWDYAVDVGAHVGFWAKDMADRFGHVYCFEPSPATFACLAKNLASYNNVTLSAMAVGDKPGHCNIRRDDRRAKNSGSEYIVVDPKAGQIKMCSLDSLELPGCDLLKVDVEGFELAVLRGAKKLIANYRPIVIMECCKKFAYRRFRVADHEAESFLLRHGYTCVQIMRPDKIFVPVPNG
jgi:FkbM family methyltransferase